jgi:arginine/lysine/ornithine decarboxylase
MPGEFINREIIDIINYYMENKVTLLGVEDGSLTVIKE